MKELNSDGKTSIVHKPGHLYELENFEQKDKPGQVVQFIEKVPGSVDSTELITVSDGTTNEDVLAMSIHRLNVLNTAFPCRENSIAITYLETALLWLNKRTADRKARGVEGKQIK
jgi:hypothetical protein